MLTSSARRIGWMTLLLLMTGGSVHAGDDGFVDLFNGRDLSGFDGDRAFWSVQDGAIVGQTSPTNTTKGTYLFVDGVRAVDFELHADFQLPSGNSGIQYRSVQKPNWQVAGYQADMDAAGKYTGILYECNGRAIMTQPGDNVVYDEAGKVKPAGEPTPAAQREGVVHIGPGQWNHYVIIARGDHVVHQINGVTFVQVTDRDARRIRGDRIAFQLHPGPPMKVMYKNIRIKTYDSKE